MVIHCLPLFSGLVSKPIGFQLRAAAPSFPASEASRETTRDQTPKPRGTFPASRFRVFFRLPLARDFLRLPQKESLLAGYKRRYLLHQKIPCCFTDVRYEFEIYKGLPHPLLARKEENARNSAILCLPRLFFPETPKLH